MAEILVKIGDSGGYRDGDIIEVKPDGWHIPPAEILAWVQQDAVPPSVAGMPGYLKRRLAQQIDELVWTLGHTAVEVAAQYDIPEADATEKKTRAENQRDKLLAYGLDTNWGWRDLSVHAVVRVNGLTMDDVDELRSRDYSADYQRTARGKRRWRLRYWEVLTPEQTTAFRDAMQVVHVDRDNPLLRAALSDEPRDP